MSLNIVREISSIGPESVAVIGDFHIANSTMLMLLISLLLLVLYLFTTRKLKERPKKTQGFLEVLYENIVSFVNQITGDEYHSKKILPIIATLFVFLGVSNLIGLIPGLTSITVGDVPLFRSPTADFNLTFTLSLGAVLALHIVSIRDWGLLGHIGKFFKFKEVVEGFKNGLKKGVMALIDFGIGLLDIIGEIAKVVSLSLRLFGNIYAGEVLAVILLGALAYVVPAAWTAMNVLVGVIQALVFGSLVAAYYMLSIKPREEKV